MKVLILGGTGSIGTAVTRELAMNGHQVTGLSRSAASDRKLEALGARPLRGDLRTPSAWVREAARADGLIQLAATFDDDMAEADTAAITAILQQAALRPAPLRMIYTGGCWLYGATGSRIADEASPMRPIKPFAWMQRNARMVLSSPAVSAAVIHPAMVYHAGGGAFSRYLDSARADRPFEIWGSIATRWPLIHREDLARAYRLLLENQDLTGHFNASAEIGVPAAEITREIARRHGHDGGYLVRSLKHVLIKYGAWAEGPALDQQMGSSKLRCLTGWQPKFSSFRDAQF
ncbi:NAD-dependent epimerase/dehydratase family protein [Leisingera aquaemixtae]|uniref:NAD-dependent epimerase/dehydratase family protein n=1 Tax=Leisingera aquaemixtae TaxID=1396826 RepID=UPI001C9757CA|nr:NAD-dependent epimerase/dehydratase family protein [Leisingera aquaemixtae]MBY6067087.1 NAD-dependent epimerase/dehydratase family protein [Leisingera aquaemixtae]